MQVLNLRKEFKVLTIKESESLKEYSGRLMKVASKIRLFGEELSDSRIVEKVFMSLLERFESKISSLEDSKDLTKITLVELFNILQAQEQRRAIKQEEVTEGAFATKEKGSKTQSNCKRKKPEDKKKGKGQVTMERKVSFHLVRIVKRPLIWRNIVGTDLTYNVDLVNNLFIWRKCVRIRTSSTIGQSN